MLQERPDIFLLLEPIRSVFPLTPATPPKIKRTHIVPLSEEHPRNGQRFQLIRPQPVGVDDTVFVGLAPKEEGLELVTLGVGDALSATAHLGMGEEVLLEELVRVGVAAVASDVLGESAHK